jgi:mRNA interferase RelE/StbE
VTELVYSDHAVEWLEKAEPGTRERIVKKLDSIQDFPEHYLKRLSGSPYHRLRVGDYRVIIDWKRDDDELQVREINHREGAYD